MALVLYTTPEERQAAIDREEASGQVMLHDDFGVGPDGENQLTFDNPRTVHSGRVRNDDRLNELYEELSTQNMTMLNLQEMLKIERHL